MIPASKPDAHEHEVGTERPHGRDDDLVERVEVAAVTRAGRERDVDRAAGAGALAALGQGAGVRREDVVLVDRDRQHVGLRVERRLRPVAVVDVPVDDGDALHAAHGAGMGGRDGEVAEDAEAHAAGGDGVVPGRADERVGVRDAAVEHGVDALDDGARGAAGDGQPAATERRDAVAGVAALGQLALGRDASQVLGRVDAQDLVVRRLPRRDAHEVVDEPADDDELVQPSLRLGVLEVHERLQPGARVAREDPGSRRCVVPAEDLVVRVAGRHGEPPVRRRATPR